MLHAFSRAEQTSQQSQCDCCSTESDLAIAFASDNDRDNPITLASRCTSSHLPRSNLGLMDRPTRWFFPAEPTSKDEARTSIPDHSNCRQRYGGSRHYLALGMRPRPSAVENRLSEGDGPDPLWRHNATSGTIGYSTSSVTRGPQWRL